MNTRLDTGLDEKIDQLQSAIEAARQEKDSSQLWMLQRKLGQHFLEQGDAPKALTEFNEALKIVSKGDDKESLAQLLGFRGIALKEIGNFSLALQAFRKSHATAKEIKHDALTCDALIQIAMIKSDMGRATEALSDLGQAMDRANAMRSQARQMRIASLMADTFYKLESFDKAVEYYVLAYEFAQKLGNHQAESSFLTKVANIFLLEEELEAAIGQYERALDIASKIEDRNAEINILGGLFRAQALTGNVPLASKYGEQVIHLSRDINHTEAEFWTIDALSSFLIERGLASQAITHIRRGIEIAGEQADMVRQATMIARLGQASYQKEDLPQALENFNAALQLTEKIDEQVIRAYVLGQLSSVYADMGEIKSSNNTALQALSLAQSLDDKRLVAEQQMLLAFNYRDSDELVEAQRFCLAAIETYESLGDHDMVEKSKEFMIELRV